jgi:signal transduction histidine kinase/CheY-like chemotaxis protein/HPt (histidine-containing phosphotransfer) domain-containing protein
MMAPTLRISKLLAISAAVAAAASGFGLMFEPAAAEWQWPALVAAVLALLAAFVPRSTTEDSGHMPASHAARPTASTGAGSRRGADPSGELTALRSELQQHKQLEAELTVAKQAAEAAMMSKGEFLATMSHEIRTPLNGIIPLLDILLSSPLGPDQREYVQTAFASSKQLLRIVDDILDYSRLDANKLELETVGLNLKDLLQSVMRLMEKPAEAKGLRLELNIDAGVRLAVRGDPVRLRQVLTNLISNAVKFTERGTVEVSVSRRGGTRTHHELRFEVRDTGVGIAADAIGKLFQPFSQADTSTTRTFGGTGLGLVICKRIVDLMDGQIGVESTPGKGSLFWFTVPLLKAIGDISSTQAGLQGSRALVLTTDPALLRRFSTSLPNWGVTPTPAANTQDALGKLRTAASRGQSWAINLLLVDHQTVRSTALALHRNILRDPALSELRVVYLTGSEPLSAEIGATERGLQVPRTLADADLRQQIDSLFRAETPQFSAPAVDPEASLAEVRPASREALQGHVLLVEDNPVNRQVAQRLLTLCGLTLDSAENGKEALDRLDSGDYDAVLMDCQMPVMDGYTATRNRRAQEVAKGLPRMPIIAMTANAMVGDREKCLDAGMDEYMSKPLNRALLEQTLRHWLAIGANTKATAASGRARMAAVAAVPAAPVRRVAPAPPAGRDAEAAPQAAENTIRPATTAPPPPLRSRPAPSNPAISLDVVADLREIMGDEFSSLVRVFLEDAPRSLAKLETAAAARDLDGLVGPAHSLKSTSANLGAMELSAQARHIEHSARQGTLNDAAERVGTLVAEFKRAEQALLELLQESA